MRARATIAPGARLVGVSELMKYTGLGRNSAAKLGRDIGARVQIGARVLYDLRTVDEFIEREKSKQTENV